MKFSNESMIPFQPKEKIIDSLFFDNRQFNHFPGIKEFYKNQEIFITGGRYDNIDKLRILKVKIQY